jgi:hypothetical protein
VSSAPNVRGLRRDAPHFLVLRRSWPESSDAAAAPVRGRNLATIPRLPRSDNGLGWNSAEAHQMVALAPLP